MACLFLQQQGLKLLERNFRIPQGEIDLVMQHNDCLVFVEVRYRRSHSHGGAAGSVTAAKCRRIHLAAQAFLQSRHLSEQIASRIDVVAISPDREKPHKFVYQWIKNITL